MHLSTKRRDGTCAIRTVLESFFLRKMLPDCPACRLNVASAARLHLRVHLQNVCLRLVLGHTFSAHGTEVVDLLQAHVVMHRG